jgi:peroxiredoxin/cold shock CspA family protein
MTNPTNLRIGEKFPDVELTHFENKQVKISKYTQASAYDKRLGFSDGYPLIIVFYRGYFCPRDQQQFRLLVSFQKELAVNFGRLVTISVDAPKVQAAFRAGLGATWPFLSDKNRELIKSINILDETEGEYAQTALPFTFVCYPDLSIHKIYNGWFFVGRPTIEELRKDLRFIMEKQDYYPYENWNQEEKKKIRVPQEYWTEERKFGESAYETSEGYVVTFNKKSGNGTIWDEQNHQELFFNFTAIPGEGYRLIPPQQKVRFEIVQTSTGKSALNIQPI